MKITWRKLLFCADSVFWLFLTLAFVGSMIWAKSRDPFARVWFKIKTENYGKAEAVAVLPKPVRKMPVVLYVYGSGGSLITSGNTLRQLSELGMASVVVEYTQSDPAIFAQQFAAISDWVHQQPWADTNKIVWVAASLGAQQTLAYLLQYPERAPHIYVRIGGGIIPEALSGTDASSVPTGTHGQDARATFDPRLQRVILVHGENDSTFPVADVHALADFFEKNGITTEKKIVPGKGHMFESDRALLTRNLGELLKARLTPENPRPEFPITKNYWFIICIAPAFIWIGCWFYLRRKLNPPEPLPDTTPTKFEKILRVTAVVLGVWAAAETAIHLIPPRLSVSENTLALARWKLIAPKWTEDFDDLAFNDYWRGQKLKTLLTHVELSNYCVYELINWKLDTNIYKNFVLSPIIESSSSGRESAHFETSGFERTDDRMEQSKHTFAATEEELNWRRPLWEFYYPRIRKENFTESAAEIIARTLRERVTIDSRYEYPTGVESAWRNQITTPAGFERIYVATLRSCGVPARLNQNKRAEFWTGSHWQPAPRPIIQSWLE